MEKLGDDLYLEKVPATWTRLAWPSQRKLAGWLTNLQLRINQLQDWVANPNEIAKVRPKNESNAGQSSGQVNLASAGQHADTARSNAESLSFVLSLSSCVCSLLFASSRSYGFPGL